MSSLPVITLDRWLTDDNAQVTNRKRVGLRCACAAASGLIVALAVWVVNSAVGFYLVSVPCKPAGTFGCAIGKLFAGLMIAVLVHMLLLLGVIMVGGGLLGWLAFRLTRIQIALPMALFGPLVLLDSARLAAHAQPLGFAVFLVLAAMGYALVGFGTTPELDRKRLPATIGLLAIGFALLILPK